MKPVRMGIGIAKHLAALRDPSPRTWPEDVLNEASFRRTLGLERKRSERSGRAFVLMLVESTPLLNAKPEAARQDLLNRILDALARSTRETDIKGWYSGSEIGVIFTEVDPSEGKATAAGLLARTTEALSATLAIEELNAVKLSFHVFPEPRGGSAEPPADPALYPDVVAKRGLQRATHGAKRVMDIGGSLFALVFFSPVFLLIAVAVKLTSRGPALFRQTRISRYGKRFTFLKFRSMYVGNDDGLHQRYVTELIAGSSKAGSSGEGRTGV
jgi:hypothetical protein